MPRDDIGEIQVESWIVEETERGKKRVVCDETIIVEAVSSVCGRRVDRGLALSTLIGKRSGIRDYAENHAGYYAERIRAFADFLDAEAGPEASRSEREARKRLDAGLCAFEDLTLLFRPGDRVVHEGWRLTTGAVVKSCTMQTWNDQSGRRYRHVEIEMRAWHHNASGFGEYRAHASISEFKGVRAVGLLCVRHIGDEELERLNARGLMMRSLAFSPSHVEYAGPMLTLEGWSNQKRPATGRAIIDAGTLETLEPELYRRAIPGSQYHRRQDGSPAPRQDVPDDELFAVVPVAVGYSLANKSWGLFDLDRIRPAEYDKRAFDLLVLDDDVKRLLKSLIRQSGRGFTDIVRGKGGGTTLLLHGKAGVGKTLTAEAISELLERPLYAISVGELGSTPESLEKGLSKVLAYASAWNAVLLLDEADIYMEARDSSNILRNAMVAIFLRLLEYYNGVLMLTTNRVRNFDEAFHSRIALAIHYPDLGADSRAAIWHNLMAAAGIEGLDPVAFAGRAMNGRQIKNTLRMAQNLAADENVPISAEHVEAVLRVVDGFRRDMQSYAAGEEPSAGPEEE